jgi:apolipoprotein D and lipocalin family protein
MRAILRFSFALLCLALLACAPTATKRAGLGPLPVQATVDLERYMGKWYVIANIPYSAEKGKVGSYVEYLPRTDGRMDDLYFFRKKDFDAPIQQWSGVAWVIDSSTNARWKAQFIWPFRFDYLILETAPDYSWAMVGHPSRDLAWIFQREASMDPALYQQLLAKFNVLGYEANRIQKVPQKPADLGQSGYQ